MGSPLNKLNERYFSSTGFRSFSRGQQGWKNDDRVTPTGYAMWQATASAGADAAGTPIYPDAPNAVSLHDFLGHGGIPPWSQSAANAAYAEFKEKALGSQASVGAAFAEWKRSLSMITSRAVQLSTAASQIARGNHVDGLNTLAGGSGSGRRRSRPRATPGSAAGAWLEYSYGWKPLVNDIYNAAEQFVEPIPDSSHSGSSSASKNQEIDVGWALFKRSRNVTHRTGGTVKLTNPNLFLLSQLGLANPLSVAWEVVPFSFVVDWFFDVGSMLDSFSDFIGTSVERPWQAHYLQFNDSTVYSQPGSSPSGVVGHAATRQPHLIQPMSNMNIQANLGSSINRGINAVALLTQILTGMSR